MYFLLTAPHPDDDICGLCDYIQHLPRHVRVGVWFMTDGNSKTRRLEATKALNIINVQDIYWRTLPFYHRQDRAWNQNDVKHTKIMLQAIQPSILAVCYDADPHETHITCFQILKQACKTIPSITNVLLYESAWGATTIYRNIVPHTFTKQRWNVRDPAKKQKAIECHESQLTLSVNDGKTDSLLERANLKIEKYFSVPLRVFCTLRPCVPELWRRCVNVDNLGEYMYKEVAQLPAHSNVIFPTGNTPLDLYRCIREKGTEVLNVYQLDEYVGSNEYMQYLWRELPSEYQFHFLDGMAENLNDECERHDAKCSHNIDLCILGIGKNGHIGFNEPPSDLYSKTRVVDLDKSTIEANQTSHTQAITLGINTIFSARRIIIIAKKNKRDILEVVFRQQRMVPASYLAHHPNVKIVVEK